MLCVLVFQENGSTRQDENMGSDKAPRGIPVPQSARHVCHRKGGIQNAGLSLLQARQKNQTQMLSFLNSKCYRFQRGQIHGLSPGGQHMAWLGLNELLTVAVDEVLNEYVLWTWHSHVKGPNTSDPWQWQSLPLVQV